MVIEARPRPSRPARRTRVRLTRRGRRLAAVSVVALSVSPVASLRALAEVPGAASIQGASLVAPVVGASPFAFAVFRDRLPGCAIRTRDAASVRRFIACEALRWRSPGGPATAVGVAWCESRLHPTAFNPTGCSGAGCGGVFQQHLGYWAARAQRFGVPDRPVFDVVANIVVSVRMAAARGTWADDWPVCGRGS